MQFGGGCCIPRAAARIPSRGSEVKKIEPGRRNKGIFEKINDVHNNFVEEGLVYYPQNYVYSSARDYADKKGLIKDVVVVR
jgi:hypothetical protein